MQTKILSVEEAFPYHEDVVDVEVLADRNVRIYLSNYDYDLIPFKELSTRSVLSVYFNEKDWSVELTLED